MNLGDLRQKIDALDEQLLPLLLQRMQLSREVAETKKMAGIPVLDATRESEILDRIGRKAGSEWGDASKMMYSTLMDVSRALQHESLHSGAGLRQQITAALKPSALPASPVLACQGVPGAYSGAAAKCLFPTGALRFFESFEDIFTALDTGQAEYGILPLENSLTGSVHEAYDLVMQYRFSLVGAYNLPISHCLLAKPGVSITDIRQVYSHPQGLSQCAAYVKQQRWECVPFSNTAAAAAMVAQSADLSLAAIASEEAAQTYGLQILARGIQGHRHNTTRFVCVARQMLIPEDADKISLIFALPHKTGSLYQILARFALCGLNLTKIESRPMPGREFQYYFYLDFGGHVHHPRTMNLLCSLAEELPEFTFLGNFKEQLPA